MLVPDSKKIVLGLSGGVDSAVSALLLRDAGYDVHTAYIECWNEPGCRAEGDRKDALKVALQLNLPFQVLDFKKEYKEKVMGYFLSEYQAGRTPNPDVMCNKIIKFGLFYEWAIKNGYEAVATGHYAGTNGKQLLIPKDKHKDQTYFLYEIKSEQLPHIVFPLQELNKDEVREIAIKNQLSVANKKDSVGICFVGDINVPKFLKDNLGEKPGEIVDEAGNILGKHHGLWFHTIGQRHGFTYDKKKYAKLNPELSKGELPALYVIDKKPKINQLVVGPHLQVLKNSFALEKLHVLGISEDELLANKKLTIRIRHTGERISGVIEKKDGHFRVKLTKKTHGIASGQSAVFYLDTQNQIICGGGGIIL
ncbi:MAG: tRNA 2-thiouridine(34) synthase MnmA [Candidatus Pacebacteria bacterium CG10_big_fil_rev_8_21_14_0_10_36_11]|nr:tRNA 2-thiouridine(34) synthase MnmA [Candidatus Pacearchaeota archaeon]OIP74133.1 MAG: tRNA 2-thiouridine(34) synthase MnmA [Candidatus Pacebacteria bacterium CG2_30_36_39]PIR64503.1 MAG: tRNA 2-thiouridine(34) synthase MnmA [Candidatus Pacebacteria bacterium CG10_big_fil_rev_8_21_14_0_10_36_11]PJC43196.1 MAG: tRNA 2-thiouridine(34) synthase MnmA [Candidatus Pacebacteria bacterium CG_4_9_14_0_2_um_filter_36_8]